MHKFGAVLHGSTSIYRGISGMRVGCLYTHNTAMMGALDNLGYFAMPSTLMQEAAHQMLQDEKFVTEYIAENLRRLEASYDALTGRWAFAMTLMLRFLHSTFLLMCCKRNALPD